MQQNREQLLGIEQLIQMPQYKMVDDCETKTKKSSSPLKVLLWTQSFQEKKETNAVTLSSNERVKNKQGRKIYHYKKHSEKQNVSIKTDYLIN